MRCPWCSADDDRVVDSRLADEGVAIRRRRECLDCGRRFTTFERVEEQPLWVVKRSGQREPFDRAKVIAGVQAASKNRPVSDDDLHELAQQVEEVLRMESTEPTTEQVGMAVLEQLKALDEIAYVRFASVYKGFDDLGTSSVRWGSSRRPNPSAGAECPAGAGHGRAGDRGAVGGAGGLRPPRRRRRGGRAGRWRDGPRPAPRSTWSSAPTGAGARPMPASSRPSWPAAGRGNWPRRRRWWGWPPTKCWV